MKLIAQKKCELYYNRTIYEVDRKVSNLRNEFHNWFNTLPITGAINTSNHIMLPNNGNHLQLLYIQTAQSNQYLDNPAYANINGHHSLSAQNKQQLPSNQTHCPAINHNHVLQNTGKSNQSHNQVSINSTNVSSDNPSYFTLQNAIQ